MLVKVTEVVREDKPTWSYADNLYLRERYLNPDDVAGIYDSPQHERLLGEGKILKCPPTTKFCNVALRSGGQITLTGSADETYRRLAESVNAGSRKQILHD